MTSSSDSGDQSGFPRARDLLSVVDELTKPSIEHVAQKTDKGEWIRTHTVEHAGLFDQLRDAGSGRTSAGSNAAKHERAIVDLDALFLYQDYAGQVVEWCRERQLPYTRNATTDLRAWYVDTLHDNTFDPREYQSRLTKWATTIRDHFDPPKWEDSNLPCPACGARYYGDAINGGGNAIRMTFRVDDDGRVHDERALCRACNLVWVGRGAIEELADEQHEKAG